MQKVGIRKVSRAQLFSFIGFVGLRVRVRHDCIQQDTYNSNAYNKFFDHDCRLFKINVCKFLAKVSLPHLESIVGSPYRGHTQTVLL